MRLRIFFVSVPLSWFAAFPIPLWVLFCFLWQGHAFSRTDIFLSLMLALFTQCLLSLAICLWSLRRIFSFKALFLALALFGLALLCRFYEIDTRSIWLDEDTQLGEVLGWANPAGLPMEEIVSAAAVTHQSPLDYYLQNLSLEFFGHSALGSRGHAAILGSIVVVVLFLCALLLSHSWILALLVGLSALLHPYLIFYSQEGKPYMSGILALSLSLLAVICLFRTKKTGSEHSLFLASSFALCFFALGFQPVVFALTAGLAMVLLPGFSWNQRSHFLLALFAAAICFAPYQIFILHKSAVAIDMSGAGWGLKSLFSLGGEWKRLLLDYQANVFLWLLVSLVFFSNWGGRIGRSSARTRALFFIAACSIAYPILNVLVFSLFIRFFYVDRYQIFSVPLLVLSFATVLYHVLRTYLRLSPLSWKKFSVLAYGPLLLHIFFQLAYLPQNFGQNARPYQTAEGYSYRSAWNEFYALVRSQGAVDDLFLLYDIRPPEKWAMKAFPGRHLYAEVEQGRHDQVVVDSLWRQSLGDWDPSLWLRRAQEHYQQIYVVIPRNNFHDLPIKHLLSKLESLPYAKAGDIKSLLIYRVPAEGRTAGALKKFLLDVTIALPGEVMSFQAHMALAELALNTGDRETMRRSLAALESWRTFPIIDRFLRRFDQGRRVAER